MSDKPKTLHSKLKKSMSLKRRKERKELGTSSAGALRSSRAPSRGDPEEEAVIVDESEDALTEGSRPHRRRASAPTFKLPDWLAYPSAYKPSEGSKRSTSKALKDRKSKRRQRDQDESASSSALTDSETGDVPHRSMRTLFTRPSTSTLASTRTTGPITTPAAPPPPFTPKLPPELWERIFQFTALSDNPFFASPDIAPSLTNACSFLLRQPSLIHAYHEYRRTMRIKCKLTLVCKLWWTIAQPVLFEVVWLTCAREAKLLANLLNVSAPPGTTLSSSPRQGALALPATVEDVKGKGRDLVPAVNAFQEVQTRKESTKSATRPPPAPTVITPRPGSITISTFTTTTVEYTTSPFSSLAYPKSHPSNPSSDLESAPGPYTFPYDTRNLGRHIRRLHVETVPRERCAPEDVLVILRHATGLQAFTDVGSIRRIGERRPGLMSMISSAPSAPRGEDELEGSSNSSLSVSTSSSPSRPGSSSSSSMITVTSTTTVTTVDDDDTTPPTTPGGGAHVKAFIDHTTPLLQQESDLTLLKVLLGPKMTSNPAESGSGVRKLAFTNYEYDFRGGGGIKFYTLVIAPQIGMVAADLEYLELTLCAKDLLRGTSNGLFGSSSSFLSSTSAVLPSKVLEMADLSQFALALPKLTSLKLTLDNTTCHVISSWDMPSLRAVSLTASDFSYAEEGFAKFFEAHGEKLDELEFSHSTGDIEAKWLTAPPLAGQTSRWGYGSTRVPLAEWCPNLRTFICSADAEWSWEDPDYIAPHILLPFHPNVQLIGVRNIEKRIFECLERAEFRDRAAVREGRGLKGLRDEFPVFRLGDARVAADVEEGETDPFFALLEQLGSLVRSDAFPALKYVRDLSPTSKGMRETGRVGRGGSLGFGLGASSGWAGSMEDVTEEDEDEDIVVVRPPTPPAVPAAWTSSSVVAGGYRHGQGVPHGGLGGLWTAISHSRFYSNVSPMSYHAGAGPHASSSSDPYDPSSSTSSSTSHLPHILPSEYTKRRPTATQLRKAFERQQSLRVLRFWQSVLRVFREAQERKDREHRERYRDATSTIGSRGVWLEDCDGMNVTLAGLRRAASASAPRVRW